MCDSVVGSEAAEPIQTTCKFTLRYFLPKVNHHCFRLI